MNDNCVIVCSPSCYKPLNHVRELLHLMLASKTWTVESLSKETVSITSLTARWNSVTFPRTCRDGSKTLITLMYMFDYWVILRSNKSEEILRLFIINSPGTRCVVCSGEAISFVDVYIFFLDSWKLIVSSDKFKVVYRTHLWKLLLPFSLDL